MSREMKSLCVGLTVLSLLVALDLMIFYGESGRVLLVYVFLMGRADVCLLVFLMVGLCDFEWETELMMMLFFISLVGQC